MHTRFVSLAWCRRKSLPRAASLSRYCRGMICVFIIVVLMAGAGSGPARAEDEDAASEDAIEQSHANEAASVTNSNPRSRPHPRSEDRADQQGSPDDGASLLFRAGVIEGQGISQNRSLVPVELFPYILSDDSMWFADLRFFSSYELTLGGNAGLGYRRYNSGMDRIFGISGWYDGDHVREDHYFQQVGLSLESYGQIVDFRSNLYLPVGDTYQELSAGVIQGSTQFSDDHVVYDQMRSFLGAMKGVDFEAGVGLPGDFAQEHGIRVFGGVYHFEDDEDGKITGASARLQANIVSGLDAGVQVTNDSFYDTRAFVNLAWTFGPLHRSQLSQKTVRGRLGEHVTRNQTVVAPTRRTIDQDVVAINPATGQPYEIAHVDSGASPGGSGDASDPFQTITQAQAANRDIVFVHAGSTFSGSAATVVMNAGDRILGDSAGIRHYIVVPESGSILLPHGPTSGNLPLLDSAPGDGVTLASNSEFSGFAVNNSVGSGIVGIGVHDVIMHDVSVDPPIGDGIRLVNSSGDITLRDVDISGVPNDGLVIDGGNANISFSGTLASNLGHDLVIKNTTGGFVDMTAANFAGSGSQGILIDSNAGDVGFKNVSLENTAGPGIEIHGNTGDVEFDGLTSVSGAAGPSIKITNLDADASVTFDDVSIDHRHGAGIVLDHMDGTVEVQRSTKITNESAATETAIDVQNSAGEVSFGQTEVTGVVGNPGVNLKDNTGLTWFDSLDVTSNGATGLYARSGGMLVINYDGADSDGGSISATNGTAVDLENTAVNVHLKSVSSSNAAVGLRLVTVPGVFAVSGDAASTDASGGTIENATVGILLQNADTVGLSSMLLDSNGIGIQSDNVNKFAFTNFQIFDSTTYGVDASNTRTLIASNSDFTGNGLANVHADFSTLDSYGYTFYSNAMNSATSDNIQIEALAGAAGSVMNLSIDSNLIGNTHAGDAGVDVNWNGTLTATVANTVFATDTASNYGVNIANTSTSGPTVVTVSGSRFSSSGANYTGLQVVTNALSQVTAGNNAIDFSGTNGTGMRFGLGPSASVNLFNNTITDSADGGTGILFDSIVGPGNVGFSNNVIQFADTGALLDRGVVFSSVTNPVIGSITYKPAISSAGNNIIFGADNLFTVPTGTTTGFVVINGVQMFMP